MGPETDFDALVLSQVGKIRRVGRSLLDRRDELDDFTQEVLLRIYANRAQLRDVGRLPQWAGAIARNTARNWNRRRVPTPVEVLPESLHPEPSAEAQMEQSERWRVLLNALSALSPTDRDLFYSHYAEEASYEELQARHGLSYKAVSFRLSRARQRVRRRLEAILAGIAIFFGTNARRAWGGVLPMKLSRSSAIAIATVLGFLLAGGVGVGVLAYRSSHSKPPSRTGLKAATSVDDSEDSFEIFPAIPPQTRPPASTDSEGQTTAAKPAPLSKERGTQSEEIGAKAEKDEAVANEAQAKKLRRQRELYEQLAAIWPRYTELINADNELWKRRPQKPDGASEEETQIWKEADKAWLEEGKPFRLELTALRNTLKELFPEAVEEGPTPTGYSWRLYPDRVRVAVGGRLPWE